MTERQTEHKKDDLIDFIIENFFPRSKRVELGQLWAFVRAAKAILDQESEQRAKLDELEWAWYGGEIDDQQLAALTRDARKLAEIYKFDEAWISAFFASLRMDLPPARSYRDLIELDEYIAGIAEAPGLMAARICGLDASSDEAIRIQSSAAQLIALLSHLKNDTAHERSYIPQDMLREVGLDQLSAQLADEHEPAFSTLTRRLVDEYRHRQAKADVVVATLPLQSRLPLQIIADSARYQARIIEHTPMVIWNHAVTSPRWLLRFHGWRRRLL